MNSEQPKWLPVPFNYSSFNGDWENFLDKVYEIFQHDFIKTRPKYKSFTIDYDSRIEDSKEMVFWHLTSEFDNRTNNRETDIRRCERISWPKPIIENDADLSFISKWETKRDSEIRILLWIEKFDYIVILKQAKNTFILITAYCTYRKHTREKLRRDREKACK